MYILTCTCGSADIEKFDNREMFWCHGCGEELHRTELVITTLDEYFEKDK